MSKKESNPYPPEGAVKPPPPPPPPSKRVIDEDIHIIKAIKRFLNANI